MRFLVRFLAYVGGLLLSGLLLGGLAATLLYFHFESQLPDVDSLRDVRLQVPLRIYSADGLLIGEYGEQRYVREAARRVLLAT